jgi:ABC-type branched-subunit amino acid transport system substrate-binding protein
MGIWTVIGVVWSAGVAAAEPVRVGVSAPLSGVLAEYGTAVRNGITLAQSSDPTVNKHLKIVFEDSQWDPKTAVSAYHALVNNHKAQVIYNWGNPTSEAVIPIAERAGTPLIAMSSDPKVAKDKRWGIRSITSAP